MTTQATQDVVFQRSQGSVWIQPDGHGTAFKYLNCAGLEGVQKNEGDITPLYCKDESRAGRFRVRDGVQGEPSPVTTSLMIPLGKAANYLFSLRCPFNLQVRYATCDRQDDPNNWEKIVHLTNAKITQRTTDALAARTPANNGEVMTTMALSADDMLEVNVLTVERLSTTEQNPLNDLDFIDAEECEGNCGPAQTACQNGYAAGSSAPYAATANVLKTTDGGGVWTATAADPFATSEDISSVVMNGDRVIVARGTADAGNPAEIAYSDDGGSTWNLVNVGTPNNQTIRRMRWVSRPYLWAVTTGGYIYFSDDAGQSWSTQDAGSATTQQLNDVDFANSRVGVAVGNSNAVVKTTDGGDVWTAVTGPAAGVVLNAVAVVDDTTWFIGSAGGNLYKTANAGLTWTTLVFSGSGAGQVRDVDFYDASFGFMLHNTAGTVGRVLQTIDGGKSWKLFTTPTNNGLNRLHQCNQNKAFAVGNFQGTSAFILTAD
jgi:photosystem II stability/assembly factor-like uncharacterized protein